MKGKKYEKKDDEITGQDNPLDILVNKIIHSPFPRRDDF